MDDDFPSADANDNIVGKKDENLDAGKSKKGKKKKKRDDNWYNTL